MPSIRQTNWCVITGAPCSGKTTVIQELEKLDYSVIHEVARAHIDEELKKGRSIGRIKSDVFSFEQQILNKKFEIEKYLPDDALIFLDRAVPDSIGYYILEGLNPDIPIQKSRQTRYKNIFFFERLTFEKDRVRSEDETISARLDHLLKEGYRMLGYDIIDVPLMPVAARIDMILNQLKP